MAHGLADETLDLILAYALRIPAEIFLDVSSPQISSAAHHQYAKSAVLLVCKRWMRIATPLLYETVILRSVSQAQALSAALIQAPDCAPFLKRLRLDGGFGPALGMILRAATDLHDLHISLLLTPKDNIKAMCAALPAINPSRFSLTVPPMFTKMIKNMVTVLGSIQASANTWTNLTTLVVAYDALVKTEVTNALFAMPNIRAVHLKGPVHTISRLEDVLRRWPDCKLHIRYENISTYDKEYTDAFLLTHAKQLVIHHNYAEWEVSDA